MRRRSDQPEPRTRMRGNDRRPRLQKQRDILARIVGAADEHDGRRLDTRCVLRVGRWNKQIGVDRKWDDADTLGWKARCTTHFVSCGGLNRVDAVCTPKVVAI